MNSESKTNIFSYQLKLGAELVKYTETERKYRFSVLSIFYLAKYLSNILLKKTNFLGNFLNIDKKIKTNTE